MISNETKEYLLQVNIIEARCLKAKNEDTGFSNPFVKIRCGNLPVQATKVINDSLQGNWNQGFTFEGIRLTDQQLQTTDLIIEVYSRNNFFSNDLIGTTSIGLSTLYKNPNHEFYNKWAVLENPEADQSEEQGFILIDAFIIGPGDRPPAHDRNDKINQDAGEDDEEINLDKMTTEQIRSYQMKKQSYAIIGKPHVAQKGFQLACYVFRAKELAHFNEKKPNAFISARVCGLVLKTKTVKHSDEPIFKEKLLFPCYFPFLNDKIVMRMFSENGTSKDIFIANIPEVQKSNDYYNLSKLIALGGRMPGKWVNLYCIPDSERNSFLRKKIHHPKEGTAFMGRVFISFALLPSPSPRCSVEYTQEFTEPEADVYTLFCDIYKVKYLRLDLVDVAVWCECRIGGHTSGINKQKKPNKKGGINWNITENSNEIMLDAIQHLYFPKDISQVPDIFINLYTGSGGTIGAHRIGYIRLSAATVSKWTATATPRWLHFSPLDVEQDSPGSVLINLQLLGSSQSTNKRIFKTVEIEKKFTLYSHIVQGFELCPKLIINEQEEEILTKIKVELSDESKETGYEIGRYPVWNKMIEPITTELDFKLDFAPDVIITCYKKIRKKGQNKNIHDLKNIEEEIGKFTVPVYSIKKLKRYPHFFNLIHKGEITGRIMAKFFITDQPCSQIKSKFGEICEILDKKQNATINVFTLGIRNLTSSIDIDKMSFSVIPLSEYSKITDDEFPKQKNEKELLRKLNKIYGDSNTNEKCLNLVKNMKFNLQLRGDDNFRIFPYIKIVLKSGKFYDSEKFVVFNLDEFVSTVSEHQKKIFKVLFDQNFGETGLAQEQKIIPKEIAEDLIVIKEGDLKAGDNYYDDGLWDNYDEMAFLKNNINNNINEEVDNKEANRIDEYNIYNHKYKEIKIAQKLKDYKNMSVSDSIVLECNYKDKLREKMAIKMRRKEIYQELKQLRNNKNSLNEIKLEKLKDLEEQYREAKKPQMNEVRFYSYDDITDDYSYGGREIYKETNYEEHSDLKIPYKKMNMYYIPLNPFSEKFESMNGYFKLGKMTDTIIKFMVDVEFESKIGKFTSQYIENEKKIQELKSVKRGEKTEILEEQMKSEIKLYNIFNETYQNKINYLYLSKEAKKLDKENNTKISLSGLIVRVYVYRCLNLAAQDGSLGIMEAAAGYSAKSRANTYLRLSLGEDGSRSIDTKAQVVPDTLNPDFYQVFQFDADLPRDWRLDIEVIAFVSGGIDQMIGRTSIDLEDRFLGEQRIRNLLIYKSYESDLMNRIKEEEDSDNKNQELVNLLNSKLTFLDSKIDDLKEADLPVEFRSLTKPGSNTAQGMIEMFVEILEPSRAKLKPPAKIEKPPDKEYEIRVIVWEARNLVLEDKKEIDAFVTVKFDPEGSLSKEVVKQTDTHLGCTDGVAIFNWRMKFDLKLPCTFPRLSFDIRDFNALSSDESLCMCTISFKRLLKRLNRAGELKLTNKWLQLHNSSDPGEPKGELRVDIWVLEKAEADRCPVGEARDEPNKDPVLEVPRVGRGISDFVRGSWLDVTAWKLNLNWINTLKIAAVVIIVLILVIILFISPGFLVK